MQLEVFSTPAFLTDIEEFKFLMPGPSYRMSSFYIIQRKKLGILIDSNGTPAGGAWSFDVKNRKKVEKDVFIPPDYAASKNKYVVEALNYVQIHFSENPGSVEKFAYPVTHAQAKKALVHFLHHRLALFGDYEDAMVQGVHQLFHSKLSPLLNNGLLTPHEVVSMTLEHAERYKIPLNSLEGFLRQIIGWREFVRGVYIAKGLEQRTSNWWNHTRMLPKKFWDGQTGLLPVDEVLEKVRETAYAHHIERLMVLGVFMLLCRIGPDDVYRWFMEMFIDAYDWVMVPNVYGMSQYADGGLMVTKPYFCGSNYIRKMSNYLPGKWVEIWDALYWTFLDDNRSLLKPNARSALLLKNLSLLDPQKLLLHRKNASAYFESLFK